MRRLSVLLAGALILAACGSSSGEVFVGATTSVRDTGLLDELLPAFQAQSGYKATPVVAGSGQVLELASRGELDVVITHSPEDEQRYIASGDLIGRRRVMENRFLLVGPPADPAGAGASPDLAAAFRRIADARATFITRGDRSGTNVRELAVWEQARVDTGGQSWYQESGVGQAESLVVASDKAAYTLVDSATFRVLRDKLSLVQYVVDGEVMNTYSVSLVNPARHGAVREEGGRAFAAFLLSPAAQEIIRSFGADRYGEPLFAPAAE